MYGVGLARRFATSVLTTLFEMRMIMKVLSPDSVGFNIGELGYYPNYYVLTTATTPIETTPLSRHRSVITSVNTWSSITSHSPSVARITNSTPVDVTFLDDISGVAIKQGDLVS